MFHDGDNFNLKFRGNGFYCFSQCRRQYSIFDIVKKINGCGFSESLIWLANLFGIEDDHKDIPVIDTDTRSYLNTLKKMRKIKNKDECQYIKIDQDILNTIEDYYHPWLEECGLTQETCKHFNVGYSRTDPLEGRVCFPITSPYGDVISINGRMPNCEMSNSTRYCVIGHTFVSKTLYNFYEVNKECDKFSKIYVVEGFKSVMKLYQNGYHNAVAAMGASLSDEQRNLLLKTGLDIVVICDADAPGKMFGQSVYNKCYKNANVKIIELSDITDVKKASVDDLTDEQFRRLEREYLWQ